MIRYPYILFAAMLIHSGPVSAQESPAKDVPCVGPMCMLTPIWKLGTMLPELKAEPEKKAIEPAPHQQSEAGSEGDQPKKPIQTVAHGESIDTTTKGSDRIEGSKTIENSRPTAKTADTENPLPIGGADRNAEKRTVARSTSRFTYRLAHRSSIRPIRISSVAPLISAKRNKSVTVAANGTEFDRLLRLASLVKTPPIKVIPAVSFVDGCRQKPADFIVDTMSNPDRVGPAIPLFTESLIIVARQDIKDLTSLRNRQVSFGLLSSSSHRVADRVFHSLSIDVREQPLDLENALDALALGDLDAVALLAPKGFDRLAHHDPSFHLLPLPDGFSPPDGLKLSRVEPSSYLGGAWSTSRLSVVTVDAVLSPNQSAQMPLSAQSVYAALDKRSSQLAANGFDLIGGNGGLTTMRSSAKDPAVETPQLRADGAGCDE